jgi:hypothetical protein
MNLSYVGTLIYQVVVQKAYLLEECVMIDTEAL